MKSIRRELLLWLSLGLVIAVAAAATSTYYRARHEARELFDYQLRQLALSVSSQRVSLPSEEQRNNRDEDFIIQIWDRDQKLFYSSRPEAQIPFQTVPGYAFVPTPAGRWRVYGMRDRDKLIQTAQSLEIWQELAAGMALRVVWPLLVILPLLGALVWLTVYRGLRPLMSVTRAVRARTASALQPLPESGLPEEVQPLVHALNDLLGRLGRAIAAQKGFIADAAHELRTPLTAVQLQLEEARLAGTVEEREAAFDDLQRGVTRAIHLVGQLLTLARQEPEVSQGIFQRVDLSEIARLVVAEQTPLAMARQIDVGISDAAESPIQADPEALRVMLGNLVDNAIRYSPSGGRVDVAVTREDRRALLTVVDEGPGIPVADRSRVFDRFFRGTEHDVPGSGLGLAIVKSIAERHRASIALDSGPGGRGLAVSVSFPM
jgi:two-component system, OmpR family, sensor kinase